MEWNGTDCVMERNVEWNGTCNGTKRGMERNVEWNETWNGTERRMERNVPWNGPFYAVFRKTLTPCNANKTEFLEHFFGTYSTCLPCLSGLIRRFALHNLCDLNPTS